MYMLGNKVQLVQNQQRCWVIRVLRCCSHAACGIKPTASCAVLTHQPRFQSSINAAPLPLLSADLLLLLARCPTATSLKHRGL